MTIATRSHIEFYGVWLYMIYRKRGRIIMMLAAEHCHPIHGFSERVDKTRQPGRELARQAVVESLAGLSIGPAEKGHPAATE